MPAAYSLAGTPRYQHDRFVVHQENGVSLTAVADGHGPPKTGHLASDFVSRNLVRALQHHSALPDGKPDRIRSAIAELDSSVIAHTSARRKYAGTTLCAVIALRDKLVCANVGDSRAVLVSVSECGRVPIVRALSNDHDASNPRERERVTGAGGVFHNNRVNGYISMTRALGDEELKAHRNYTSFPVQVQGDMAENMFISEPEVTETVLGGRDIALIVASDGVWNWASNEEVGRVVCNVIASEKSVQNAAKAVVQLSAANGSSDNITAIVSYVTEEGKIMALLRNVDSVPSTAIPDGEWDSSTFLRITSWPSRRTSTLSTTNEAHDGRQSSRARPRPKNNAPHPKTSRRKRSFSSFFTTCFLRV